MNVYVLELLPGIPLAVLGLYYGLGALWRRHNGRG